MIIDWECARYTSLNPYYTGIHLHSSHFRGCATDWCVLILIILEYIYIKNFSRLNNRIIRLNPYYTGIHLHFLRNLGDAKSSGFGLNPYYTGIHLHSGWWCLLQCSVNVLILIILEYIYMPTKSYFWQQRECVLILIILEYIYIKNFDSRRKRHES